MNQNLKNIYITYSQFKNLIFGFLPKMKKKSFKNEIIFVISFIIENYGDTGFCLFINNYINITIDFDTIFEFLYTKYFFKTAFESIYLLEYKIYIFIDNLEIMRFTGKIQRLRLLIKYQKKVLT